MRHVQIVLDVLRRTAHNAEKKGNTNMLMLTATAMATRLGVSPAEVNLALEEAGLQTQIQVESDLPGKGKRKKWVATALGEPISEIRKGNKGLNPYEILLWHYTVLEQIGFVRPPSRKEFEELTTLVVSQSESIGALKTQIKQLETRLIELGLRI
jgi:hypothetical protein